MIRTIKRRAAQLVTDLKYTYFSLAAGDTTCLSRADGLSIAIGITATVLCFMTNASFAGGLIDEAGNVADDIKGELVKNVTKFAGLALGACLIWFFLCTSDEDAKRPLRWGKRIILAYIAFMLIGAILSFIETRASKIS